MCGIVGVLDGNGAIEEKQLRAMADAIGHRGPDDEGYYLNKDNTVGLGHRRLSFLDLTAQGRQPLCNNLGTVWITFNGEIYNHLSLKAELIQMGYCFKTTTDTEVLLYAYEQWGVDMLQRLQGMWAFAIWDEDKQTLFAARDRFGIKPFYYGEQKGLFVFASELKAIVALNNYPLSLNISAFADYFNYRYVPPPNTIWNEVKKLPAAHYLLKHADTVTVHEYWSLKSYSAKVNPIELVEEIDHILFESIKSHTQAEVPIGAFLSGGYDSSAIVYYMHRAKYPLQTFSIGFDNWDNSEHQYAEMVAKQFGSKHTSYMVDDANLGLLSHLAWVYDEPIADISTLPTYMVSKQAAQSVKAVLSGEGSDEIFVGYNWQRQLYTHYNWKKLKHLVSNKSNHYLVDYYANAMAMGRFDRKEQQTLLHTSHHAYIRDNCDWYYAQHFQQNLSPLKAIQYMDIKCFMGELVLTKVDRASMANSLEVRVPFLNHQLFEKIFGLAESQYHKPEQTKALLFEQIKSVFPPQLLQRKKQGFVGPDVFYQNLPFYQNVLQSSCLVEDNLINAETVKRYIETKQTWKLWKIVVMEFWYRRWVRKSSV